ncbi:unnamed protein product [Meloidogyne enterolobii]|uniref:Uncharacterized protein n=1 Tax=Meloidogyne enterolobii TaxID=390850 RepID=A0ACB0Z3A2_MELEN
MVIFCLAQHGWMARQHGTVDWMAQSMALVALQCSSTVWQAIFLPMMVFNLDGCSVQFDGGTCSMDGAVWFGMVAQWCSAWWPDVLLGGPMLVAQCWFGGYVDPLFSSMVACLLIGLGEYAHWTGWWKNMLVCWVVENMLIGGVLAWWWCSSTWSSSTIGGGLGSSELSSWYV